MKHLLLRFFLVCMMAGQACAKANTWDEANTCAKANTFKYLGIASGLGSAAAFMCGVYALARGQAGPLSSIIKQILPTSTYSNNKVAAGALAWLAASTAPIYGPARDIEDKEFPIFAGGVRKGWSYIRVPLLCAISPIDQVFRAINIYDHDIHTCLGMASGAGSAAAFMCGVYALARGQAGLLSGIIKQMHSTSTYSNNRFVAGALASLAGLAVSIFDYKYIFSHHIMVGIPDRDQCFTIGISKGWNFAAGLPVLPYVIGSIGLEKYHKYRTAKQPQDTNKEVSQTINSSGDQTKST